MLPLFLFKTFSYNCEIKLEFMETNDPIASFKEQVQYHRTQFNFYCSLFNNHTASLFIGKLPAQMSKKPLYGMIDTTDEGYTELKQAINKIADYHYARSLWCLEQIAILQKSVTV